MAPTDADSAQLLLRSGARPSPALRAPSPPQGARESWPRPAFFEPLSLWERMAEGQVRVRATARRGTHWLASKQNRRERRMPARSAFHQPSMGVVYEAEQESVL